MIVVQQQKVKTNGEKFDDFAVSRRLEDLELQVVSSLLVCPWLVVGHAKACWLRDN